MSLESEVAALTDAATDLLSAVNTSKATLDQAKDSAVERAAVALAQAGIATDKASEASASASTASTQAGIATAKADIATTKASEASGSAQTATTQASIATTKADEASASASTATTQAGTATTKAGEASTSAAAALASQNAAATSATNASASASTANTKAGEASGSAAQALAIYGDTAAVNTAVATAQAQASLAAGYAASAGSVVQQDLSGVNASLHSSPNAITAMFIYDVAKTDSDGGAWTEKCSHTSWWNEPLNGKWLGAQATESAARAVSGATTGDYFQLTTDGKFYKLNDTSGTTEVFRGNKRSFPKVAAIVAEAGNVNIYDLTEPGRPMFARFGNTSGYAFTGSVSTLTAINGLLVVGSGSGVFEVSFPKDTSTQRNATSYYLRNGNLANRNAVATFSDLGMAFKIVNATVNAVAMTVLSDAPLDPVTGLKVPTIGIATAGGISVIQNTGIVRNSSSTSAFTQITLTPQLLSAGRADALWYSAQNPNALGASFALASDSATAAPDFNDGNTSVLRNKGRSNLVRSSGAVVQMLRNNEATVGKGIAAKLSDTFNAGTLLGDIRRCFLADTATGSVTGTVSDRSYKAKNATIEGTLTAAAVANNAQLVAYSGFSAANYAREPYSADLDFGTGEWSVGAWVNTTQLAVGGNLLTYSEQFNTWGDSGLNAFGGGSVANTTATTDPNGGNTASYIQEDTSNGLHRVYISIAAVAGRSYTWSIYAKAAQRSWIVVDASDAINRLTWFDLTNGTVGTTDATRSASIQSVGNGWFRCTVSGSISSGSITYLQAYITTGNNVSSYTGDGTSGLYIWGAQLELGSTATDYKPTTGTAILPVGALAHRSYSSGPMVNLEMTHEGKLRAVAFDGTTTRTVTTSAAYNTGVWTKVRATYTTDGTLGLTVNGQQVATTTGAPLLTLNNSNAVLTIGNSFALDAPFPGSIALLKFSATVPTAEQSQWMYEQEKQLFREGAQCVLPSSGNVLDLAYDDETDTWSALQATHESTWAGLVRTSTQTPSAGSFAKCVAGSGNKLLARTTTNPGVDIQMPSRNLRAELRKRREALNANQDIVVFDYFGGFTATTTNGSTALTSVAASLYPSTTNLIGCAISGTGIPASTVITGISGTTIYMSKAATANGSNIQISTTDFNLPVGYTARAVMTAGTLKREGSTSDYSRLFDGFRETIRFAVAPGYNAWVQIQAVNEVT